MAVLYNSGGGGVADAESWRAAFRKLDPEMELRVWPETGPVEEIEFVLAWRPEHGDLLRYPKLKAVFWLGAGVDWLVNEDRLPDVPFVRLVDPGLTAGMTEYVVLHTLRYHRRQPELDELQRRREWVELDYPLPWRRRVGILGLGVLGGDAARKLKALDFDVAGWSRTPKSVEGVTSFHGDGQLDAFLARSEILVCLLPLTPQTRGIVDAKLLSALPRGACFINAGRGAHVVDADLLAALDSGQIAHATLDVFNTEPLPPSHPYWTHPRVTVTPHIASITHAETAAPGIYDGMRRARAGLKLENVVDFERGY
ncbi:MAG: glyoxylate/hydroxypyruvate reductase A [Alphaproteobacteria bacterium]|nr:MAG: glyoxylate/hydroxypyruvate reductase A [Alphaproteobacteria bacterium]